MTTLDVTKWIHRFLGQYESLKLTCCFRLPEEYARHVGELWGKSIVGVNPDCRVVEMTSPEALHYLSEQKPGDVLCLGERGTMLAMFLNELERLYPERYNKNTVYASIRNEDRTMQPNLEKAAIFTSYDSSKGMERPVCVVLNWTETYWNKRVQKPMTRREIMRNVFLVAASRGKRDIIFALDEGDQRLTDESLTGHAPGVRVFREPFDIGTMFEYRFAEDIERCYRLLDVQQLCGPELEDLDIPLRDGFIDLSPCIGIYQRAAFFRNIDVDMLIWQYVQEHPDTIDITIPPGADLETKILVLAGYVTQYRRYVEQVEVPYVTGEQEDRLKERLGMLFTGDEEVDGYCEIRFLDQVNEECIIRGHMDVEKDGAVYDLRYVSELSHESYLELACYLLGSGHETGVLCNMRNGEMWQVKVPDKEKFLTQVVRTITKGAVQEYVEPPEVPDDADVPATDLKEILRQISQDDPGDSVPSWDMVSAPPGGDDLDEVF